MAKKSNPVPIGRGLWHFLAVDLSSESKPGDARSIDGTAIPAAPKAAMQAEELVTP